MRRLIIPMFLLGFGLLAGCTVALGPIEACGNGVIEDGEDCDGANLGGETCVSSGYAGGTLACTGGCAFDTSGCTGPEPVCGNGAIEGAEECDGADLGSETCISSGYSGGTLACTTACGFDTSGCTGPEPVCGNGAFEDPETCDDGNFAPGDGCSGLCTIEDGWNCTATSPSVCTAVCGDDQVLGDEECDGADLGGETCESLGYQGGALSCASGCHFDFSLCTGNMTSPNIGVLNEVPAGTFQRDGEPANLSTVSAFHMSKYEITRAQWVAVTQWPDPSDTGFSFGTDDPVQQVSWYGAIAFCNKLSLMEGLTPVYSVSGVDFTTITYDQIPTVNDDTWNQVTANWDADGYRLSTEMEWMWAAMGADTESPGVVNTSGYSKAFSGSDGSNFVGDYVVFGYFTSEEGRTMTMRSNPVGSKLANELGFHDLSGNVYEWVWDSASESFPSGSLTDYRGPASGPGRIMRGGGWNHNQSDCTVAYRNPNYTSEQADRLLGFRVVRRR